MRYVVISPVKDEQRNIERCIQSMIQQTRLPVSWVIVDDGSSDQTGEIARRYAGRHPFMSLVTRERGTPRQTGIGELLAFNAGYESVRDLDFDCLVKLDGDLSFEPDYFERLISEFAKNPKLGIGSGIYLEERDGRWQAVEMPEYHAAGACKAVRRRCFDDIKGFIPHRGWDSVDEIRAMTLGWETRHFPHLRMKHWRPEGTGMGYLSTCYMHGEIYYRTGGGAFFFLLKVAKRLTSRPWIAGATALAWGYFHSAIKGHSRLVTQREASLYRALLNRRVLGGSGMPVASAASPE